MLSRGSYNDLTDKPNIESKLILDKTIEADTADNITLLTSLSEGLYEFVIDGYLPTNLAFYFEGLTDVSKFSYVMTNTQLVNNTVTQQVWANPNIVAILALAGYNSSENKQIAKGTFEIKNNIFSYSRNTFDDEE